MVIQVEEITYAHKLLLFSIAGYRQTSSNINPKELRVMVQKLVKFSLSFSYLWDKLWAPIWKRNMKHCGKRVYIRPMSSDFKGIENLSVGDDTIIPKGSVFYCTRAELKIGSKVLFGPNPTIITGDHRIDVIGKYIADVTDAEKLPNQDAPIVIEDDVWCGANVTILKGVTIGRGSVVAAGAVVTKSCPPYSILGGGTSQSVENEVYT